MENTSNQKSSQLLNKGQITCLSEIMEDDRQNYYFAENMRLFSEAIILEQTIFEKVQIHQEKQQYEGMMFIISKTFEFIRTKSDLKYLPFKELIEYLTQYLDNESKQSTETLNLSGAYIPFISKRLNVMKIQTAEKPEKQLKQKILPSSDTQSPLRKEEFRE